MRTALVPSALRIVAAQLGGTANSITKELNRATEMYSSSVVISPAIRFSAFRIAAHRAQTSLAAQSPHINCDNHRSHSCNRDRDRPPIRLQSLRRHRGESLAPCDVSERASSAQTCSASSCPEATPTFETLLFTRRALRFLSASRLRPMSTGAPGNAFFVKTPAKLSVGCTSSRRVIVIDTLF